MVLLLLIIEFYFIAIIYIFFPLKPQFRNLKIGVQEFHRKFVLAPADKAADTVVVV